MTFRAKFLAGAAAALCLGVLAAGCVSLLPDPPPPGQIYTLSAGPVSAVAGPAQDVVVAIAEPGAPRSLLSNDIVWRTDGAIAFVEGAGWDGPAPALLQTVLIDILSQRGAVRAAAPAGAVRADLETRWTVNEFGIVEEDGARRAVFSSAFYLVDARTRAPVATTRVEESVPLSSRSASQAVQALQQAAREGLTEAADWIAASASAAVASQPNAASNTR